MHDVTKRQAVAIIEGETLHGQECTSRLVGILKDTNVVCIYSFKRKCYRSFCFVFSRGVILICLWEPKTQFCLQSLSLALVLHLLDNSLWSLNDQLQSPDETKFSFCCTTFFFFYRVFWLLFATRILVLPATWSLNQSPTDVALKSSRTMPVEQWYPEFVLLRIDLTEPNMRVGPIMSGPILLNDMSSMRHEGTF